MSLTVDLGGNTLVVENLRTGATSPGLSGTALTTDLAVLSGASAANSGTTKALITGTSGALTIAGVATFAANPTFSTGNTLKLGSGTATLSSNAATVTKYGNVITTESLTTAAGSSQAFVITLTGVAAGDLAFVQGTGTGSNTRMNHTYRAATTTNTITVTVFNNEPTNALNGTLVFNLWVVKA